MSKVRKLPLSSLYEEFASSARGLTKEEAPRRLEEHGPNELLVRQDVHAIVKFLLQFRNYFALLLMAGGALAIAADQLAPGKGGTFISPSPSSMSFC